MPIIQYCYFDKAFPKLVRKNIMEQPWVNYYCFHDNGFRLVVWCVSLMSDRYTLSRRPRAFEALRFTYEGFSRGVSKSPFTTECRKRADEAKSEVKYSGNIPKRRARYVHKLLQRSQIEKGTGHGANFSQPFRAPRLSLPPPPPRKSHITTCNYYYFLFFDEAMRGFCAIYRYSTNYMTLAGKGGRACSERARLSAVAISRTQLGGKKNA